MGSYRFICGCGHVVTTAPWEEMAAHWNHGLAGLRTAALCPWCATQARVKAKVAENSWTAEGPAWPGALRPLTGSPFQVAWANDLRDRHLATFARCIGHLPAGVVRELTRSMIHLIHLHLDAGWWIAHRDNTFAPLIPDAPMALRHWVIVLGYGEADRLRRHSGWR